MCLHHMQMHYAEQTVLFDSDRESNKSDDDVMKEQQLYIWNKNYGVRQDVCMYVRVLQV